ncbi:pyrroline-5-carboxylate reductase [Candidatus Omnitrophota bacterium]
MIGIIGAGNMGRAIALRIDRKALISDVDPKKTRLIKSKRIKVVRDNIYLAKHSKVIILAVKPQHIAIALKEICPFIKDKLIISIAAGIGTGFIEKVLKKARVIRVMPNMPAMVGMGISAITRGRSANKKDLDAAYRIFLNVGEVVEVKEIFMDAVTAVSGSGPAYYFLFTHILEKLASEIGLEKALAKRLARATFVGAAATLAAANISTEDLVNKVASKGGTTEAALKILKQKGLERIVKGALKAARDRSRSLTK